MSTKKSHISDDYFIDVCGTTNCPDCGIHLSNGFSTFADVLETTESLADALAAQEHQFFCMGCGHEWGDKIDPEQVKAEQPKRTYENKSSISAACQVVHDLCNEMKDARRKDVIQAAVDKGVAFYTARTQYQKWFKAQKSAKGLATRRT
jgi:hypothetical protein